MKSLKSFLNKIPFFSFLLIYSCATSNYETDTTIDNYFSHLASTSAPNKNQNNINPENFYLNSEVHDYHSNSTLFSSDLDKQELSQGDFLDFNAIELENNFVSNFGDSKIIWPTRGVLTSLFGVRTLRRKTYLHTGIDIGAPKGTKIYAATNGRVIFAGKKRGYGYVVIIAFDNIYQTLYAHMSKILVRSGKLVHKNQLIGLVGKTGKVTGANLHFETRIHGVVFNPLTFLPPSDIGKIKPGMRTPNYAEQMHFYNKNRVAYRAN